ncbi:DNA-binding transcriptional regulator MetR [Klebsiella pneumoniae]|uniref:DNA-binding transcriptional regulator MetR n=1 Tax=Klebsiella pneumoniae TaxID=573 RepID=A0A2X3EY19_KLEPN|nr:DNA-binding transcriptional regulator MetR [Klebsiella pneumoniae]
MIEIKHLKTLQALRKQRFTGGCGSGPAPDPVRLVSPVQRSGTAPWLFVSLCVRASRCVLLLRGKILLQLANQVLPQIARALQDCNEPQQTRLRLAIECHSCIQWLTPALENFRARWPHVEVDFHSGVTFDPQPALQAG